MSVLLSLLEKDRQVRVSPNRSDEVDSGWSGKKSVVELEAETTLSPWASDL